MSAPEPRVRDLLWRGLNPLGRTATVLLFILPIWLLLELVLPGEPLGRFWNPRPSVVHYIAIVLLMMIDVPLAWTAWKTLKSDRGRRAMVVIFLFIMIFTFVEARIALQKEDRWVPRTPMMVLYTLLFIQLGLGRKRTFSPGTPDPEKPEPVSESSGS